MQSSGIIKRNVLRFISLDSSGAIVGSPKVPESFILKAVAVREDGWVNLVDADAYELFLTEFVNGPWTYVAVSVIA